MGVMTHIHTYIREEDEQQNSFMFLEGKFMIIMYNFLLLLQHTKHILDWPLTS